MIIVRLKGGLGNQMFQYSLGRSLMHQLNSELLLDTSLLEEKTETHSYRKYALDVFNIPASVKVGNYSDLIHPSFINRFFFLKKGIHSYIETLYYQFDKKVFEIPGNFCLDGYWQCFRYFEKNTEIIHRDFLLKNKLGKKATESLEKIRATHSVSVHIRRGDYISNTQANAHHGSCDIAYYRKAVQLIKQQYNDVVFFVFSDDPQWVKDNFLIDAPFFVVSDEEGIEAHEEIQLMGFCNHAIIANSSFSWWGAWLIQNEKKIVVAPQNWIRDEAQTTIDLCPHSWLRI